MLAANPLEALARDLANVIASFGLAHAQMGRPDVVRKAAEESAKLFQGYAKARPSKEDAYAAALAFMRGQRLDERQVDMVAAALSEQVREAGNRRPLGHGSLPALLEAYSRDAEAGNLWRLTWFGLLGSYFAFDPLKAPASEREGWVKLRAFLERTWPLIDRETGAAVVPDWVKVIRTDPDLLSENAALRYGLDYVRGNDNAVNRLSADLGVPESSWFWHALVLSAVRRCAEQSDDQFKATIPKLLALIERRPVFRDEALEVLLTRYQRCAQSPLHLQLRDYVVRKDVWRNPKLRAAGLATAWNRVSDAVWKMVLQWVNEGNLRDFFDVLAARNEADQGRLAFWSKYMKQISWTRLIFGAETLSLANRQAAVRELIAREEDAYATLTANRDVDAFMMQIGDHIIVEFSKKPNACYVYATNGLKFDCYRRTYQGGTEDLKYGYYEQSKTLRITHPPGWEPEATHQLKQLGIFPDGRSDGSGNPAGQYVAGPSPPPPAPAPRRVVDSPPPVRPPLAPLATTPPQTRSITAPLSAPFSMSMLEELVRHYPGAGIDDKRAAMTGGGGRLWVEDPLQQPNLADKLKRWGFRWSDKRTAYYYPEN